MSVLQAEKWNCIHLQSTWAQPIRVSLIFVSQTNDIPVLTLCLWTNAAICLIYQYLESLCTKIIHF